MLKPLLGAALAFSLVSVAACDNSAEESGENMDSAIEETFQGEENLGDGPMEQAGESVDSMTGETNSDPVDNMSDAMDGEEGTTP